MGQHTDNVFDIEDNFRGSNQMKVCVDRVKAIPEARVLMESRYIGPEIDLEALSQLSCGTLGHTYATVMKALGYDPNFFRQGELETDMAIPMKPLIAQGWEDGWDKTLRQWREDLNITNPVIDEPYSLKNRLPDLDLDW